MIHSPRIPRVENLEFFDLMGDISSNCTIPNGHTRRASAGSPQQRLQPAPNLGHTENGLCLLEGSYCSARFHTTAR